MVDASTATGNWYAKNEAVARAHNLLDGVAGSMDGAASRFDMAALLANVLRDKGADMPDAEQRGSVMDKIADWGDIPAAYRGAVCDVYYMGIIGGIDTKGTFAGENFVTRAVAATIYARAADVLAANGGGETPAPEQPTPTPEPEPTPSGGAAPIGTISDTPVTLSLDTHHVSGVPDYWSEQSTEIKLITQDYQEAFNAAVHSMINSEKIANEGAFGTGFANKTVNLYYNYPVYKPSYTSKGVVEHAVQEVYFHAPRPLLGSSNGLWFVTAKTDTALEAIFVPYLSQISPTASSQAKANLMMEFVCSKLTYQAGSSLATWTNGQTTGDCESYQIMFAQLASFAGVPNIRVTSSAANHAWNQVYLEDQDKWVIYDASAKDIGNSLTWSFESHAAACGYSNEEVNNPNTYKVARALIETACRYT